MKINKRFLVLLMFLFCIINPVKSDISEIVEEAVSEEEVVEEIDEQTEVERKLEEITKIKEEIETFRIEHTTETVEYASIEGNTTTLLEEQELQSNTLDYTLDGTHSSTEETSGYEEG